MDDAVQNPLDPHDEAEAIRLELITPSIAELMELAKRFPPPQSWWEETENPFESAV